MAKRFVSLWFWGAMLCQICTSAFAGDTYLKQVKQVEKLAAECQAGKVKSCQKLFEIIVSNNNETISYVAVGELTDQTMLRDVAKKAKSPTVRLNAARKLISQTDLAPIAKDDISSDVRKTLVREKLTDLVQLTEIAKSDGSPGVREEAVRKMTDQHTLAEIAKTDSDGDVRVLAVAMLTDQAAIMEIAKRDNDPRTKDLAWSRITVSPLLAVIATTDPTEIMREEAVRRLNNQAVLAEVAKSDASPKIRAMAVDRLSEPAPLADVKKNATVAETRQQASDALRRIESAMLLKACLSGDALAVDKLLQEGKSLSGSSDASRALLGLLISRTERSISISNGGVQGFSGPSEREQQNMLDSFTLLLRAGADPAAMRILGFEPAGEERMGAIVRYSTGSPGRVVPASEGGLSAMEFAERNKLDDYKKALAAAPKH